MTKRGTGHANFKDAHRRGIADRRVAGDGRGAGLSGPADADDDRAIGTQGAGEHDHQEFGRGPDLAGNDPVRATVNEAGGRHQGR